MPLRERFEEELQDVVFSKKDQDRLKEQLVLVARKTRRLGIRSRLDAFWNGSVEIPLPAALAMILVLGLGLWTTYSALFAVDQTVVALFIKVGSESMQEINQGVSVL